MASMNGRVVQISVSNGGVPKTAVPVARITETGVEGDRQANPEIHGGPERAVCLFSMERIRDLQAEGHAIVPGAAGRVYARVLVPGTVRAGDAVRMLPPGVGAR
jgi:MOSC domain-containing protein YiiM